MAEDAVPNLTQGDVHWLFAGPKLNAIDALDHSPDEAAKAVKIARATGNDPNIVYGDLDNYERQAKTEVSNGIVGDNKYLRSFLSDPIAAKLTNDDLGNLDEVTQVLDKFHKGNPLWEAQKAAIAEFKRGFGSFGDWVPEEDERQHPMLAKLAKGLVPVGVETAARGISASIGAIAAGAGAGLEAGAKMLGVSPQTAGDFGRDIRAMTELHLMGLSGVPHGAPAEPLRQTANRAEPWVAKGAIPPVGVDPVIDQFHIEQAKTDAEGLRDSLKAMAKTNLRERSSDFAAKLAGEVVSGDIQISRDAVQKLYGDKPPEPDDGLLGWVPGIAEQLKGTGDITVPLADYLGKVDPKVAKELEEGVRVRPEGLTPEEAKAYEPPEQGEQAIVANPDLAAVQSLRQGAALEPTKGKDVSLTLADSSPEGRHAFDIKDPSGASIGELYIAEEEGGKRLYIDDIRSAEGSQSIGPRAIRRAASQLFAQFPTAEEIRGMRVSGAREKAGERYSDMVLRRDQVEKAKPAFDGAAPGLTKAQTDKAQRLIAKKLEEDQEFLRKQEEKLAQRVASKEFVARKNELRGQVAEEIASRPDVDLEDKLRRGQLRIDPESLTEAERAKVPKEWLAEDGVRLDDLLAAYGGDAVTLGQVAALAQHRTATGMGPIPFRRSLVEATVHDRALAETRKVDLEAIWDHVLSETQEEILHEDTLRYATEAGQQYPIKTDAIREAIIDEVRASPAREATEARYMAEAGRAGRKIQDAGLNADPLELFKHSQAQEFAFIKARYAKEIAKQAEETAALAKKYSKREVKGTLPEYTNAIHSILQKVGGKIGRRPEDLATENAALGYKDLPDFLAQKEGQNPVMELQIPVADFLLDPAFQKEYKDLSVEELQGLHQSLKTLDHLGRSENKIEVAGEKYVREELINDMGTSLIENYGEGAKSLKEAPLPKKFARQVLASHYAADTLFQRFDRNDPDGVFTTTLLYPGARAANGKNVIERQLATRYKDIGPIDRPNEVVEHSFADPVFGGKRNITRAVLDNIIGNIGNKYNRDRAAFTLGVTPEELMTWVESVTRPKDITRSQKRGDTIWQWLKGQDDNVYRHLYGVAPENILIDGFQMHGRQYDGWYHPIITDAERSARGEKFERDPTTKPTNFWPNVRNSFTKRRTGVIDQLDFAPGRSELVMEQMVHDIAMREYVNDTSKIILNRTFKDALSKSWGPEYNDVLKVWLYKMAGSASYNPEALSYGARVANFFRQNAISTYIAYNIGTVYKHAPTAAIMSMREVPDAKWEFLKNSLGQYFKKADVDPRAYSDNVLDLNARDPALGGTIRDFVWKYSEEIQRRERHWVDTFSGGQDIALGKSSLRERVMEGGAKAVAWSDRFSADPLWYTKYQAVLKETGDHAKAVDRADLAVRNAHGSTSDMARPIIAMSNGPLAPFFTSLYGFFGANMQRKLMLGGDISDRYVLGAAKELHQARRNVPNIALNALSYVVAPVVIEELVASQFTDDRHGYGHKALNATLLALTNSIIGLRDFTWGVEHGTEPSVGMLTAIAHDLSQPLRDLGKPRPMSKANAGKLVQDTLSAVGVLTGSMPKPVARATRFGIDVANRQQNPRTFGDYYRGIISGQMKRRVEK